MYTTLMEKYNWTPEEIDRQDFFKTLDLESGDWKKEIEAQRQDPIVYIDDLGF